MDYIFVIVLYSVKFPEFNNAIRKVKMQRKNICSRNDKALIT